MAQTTGRINFGCPTVKLTIGGSRTRLEFEAIVDTGFSGFILLPITSAVPLGLELEGMSVFDMVDGTQHQWPTAIANIEFGSHYREMSIALPAQSNDILLGMEFLRSFEQSLVIHRNQVFLMDESDLDVALARLH